MQPLTTATLSLADRLRRASSLDTCWGEFVEDVQRRGFATVMYGFLSTPHPTTPISTEAVILDAHPAEFSARYVDAGHFDHDYGVYHAQMSERPFRWFDPAYLQSLSPRQLQVEEEARDFGLRNGLSVPLRDAYPGSWGAMGFNAGRLPDREFEEIWANDLPELIQISDLFHAIVTEAGLLREHLRLSPREEECLLWAAGGLRGSEIAARLSLREETVRFHLKGAAQKLNARNTTHAVSKALALNLLRI